MSSMLNNNELVGGTASTSKLLYTDIGISFWGGVDPLTSIVTDHTHPLFNQKLSNHILALPNGRGSCTGSQVVLELLLNGIAPRAFILKQPDAILSLGVIVAEELFNISIPIVCVGDERFKQLSSSSHAAIVGSTVIHGTSSAQIQTELDAVLSAAKTIPSSADVLIKNSPLTLTKEEQNDLDGINGKAIAVAMRIVVRSGVIDQAPSLLEITQAHIDGCTYIGPGGLQFAEKLVELGGQVKVPTTLNSNSVDRKRWKALGVSSDLGEPAYALGNAYLKMGCSDTSFTCAPYLLKTKPTFGEHIGWGESNAVVFSNSVLGARTQKYADYLDIAAAITGRVPLAGSHLDSERVATVILDATELVHTVLGDENNAIGHDGDKDAFFPMLGYICGLKSESNVPLLIGLEKRNDVTEDHLKAFCAAFGSTASVPMFHMLGQTPEAPNISTACGGEDMIMHTTIDINMKDLNNAWKCLDSGERINNQEPPAIQLVAIGNPHLSLNECKEVAALCVEAGDVQVKNDVSMIATLGRDIYNQADELGYVNQMERFGITFINDTCWCMLTEPVVPVNGAALITNSGKYAHYAPGLVGKQVHFHGLKGCMEAAKTGRVPTIPSFLLYRGFKTLVGGMRRL